MPFSRNLIFAWFPLTLLGSSQNDYFSNQSLVDAISKPIHSELCEYLLQFFGVLKDHMENEHEVQIRDGKITDDGQAALRELHSDYEAFQYEIQVNKILKPWVNAFIGQPNQETVNDSKLKQKVHL